MKHCIVNFSDSKFKVGQDRLKKSLIEQNYQGDIILFNDYNEVGSEHHLIVPYQFKVYSMKKAFEMGYDIVLYCDASIYAIKNVQPAINHIIEYGFIMEYCGFKAGQFSTDSCLEKMNLTRDEAMDIQLHSAGFTGININDDISRTFFETWLNYAKEKETFIGDWNNKEKQCSNDERCLGHRHDQTVASIIAHNLGMNRMNPHFMQYIYDGTIINESTIFGCRGIV